MKWWWPSNSDGPPEKQLSSKLVPKSTHKKLTKVLKTGRKKKEGCSRFPATSLYSTFSDSNAHYPAPLWHFYESGAVYKMSLLTYLLACRSLARPCCWMNGSKERGRRVETGRWSVRRRQWRVRHGAMSVWTNSQQYHTLRRYYTTALYYVVFQ